MVAPFMGIVPHHLIPMPGLMNVCFAVYASSNVLGPLVLTETILAPVRSFILPGVVELTSSGTVRILAKVAKLVDLLMLVSWPNQFICDVIEGV